ncbi:MAG TPA: TetR/AcrR family transcriptional regulator [Mycetocola sp.]|jgi:AcrR family transcriptional regulator|uniref:TetR/AcrR family transcriptional regulator n=1 Tax=Mycetocola sp. TaxID=1871042 RepID=UPI002608CFC0|nr:TetR/AcrR family transcriptional regulator [Mycetocola sp.]MCU1420007.1 Transcriptional regulator, TetR family [Mycetocola sp.]MCU1560995.1 Transcriptional regulator, TetR family [Mycetocola sp.]HEV7848444.1 TetR/AcrR family transcriptional regulator [Mycetocola sp.]
MPSEIATVEPAQIESARRRKTRDRLMDAAYEVFAETGVPAASVEMITERAGFTRGAFYSNFDTKEELFFALAERENRIRLERLQEGVDAILPELDQAPLTEATLGDVVARFLELQSDDQRWCIVQSEFKLLAMRNPAVAASYLAYQRGFLAQLADRIDDAVRSVGLRFTLEPITAIGIIVNVYESALQEAILEGSDSDSISAPPMARATLPALVSSLTEPLG